ncbi:hypothetical protein DB30_07118 [Enhygromyxa salina]|uniref:Uncharacterized protein n=1 Tax=Enhygromyxa salina TaxID=215803 RepID=A0A0C2D1T5_9BACT|nr:hypothetical protein [Enhygromyxa salina]KIG14122.1 hypothetical protein DB30_07118 [Enhygromyxa salina]
MVAVALLCGCGGLGFVDLDAEDMERAEDLMMADALNPQQQVPGAVLDDLAPPAGDNGNLKLCTIWFDSPNYWRESFVAPQGWSGANCDEYRKNQGGVWYSLTCLTSSGFQAGTKGGSLPAGNLCGW